MAPSRAFSKNLIGVKSFSSLKKSLIEPFNFPSFSADNVQAVPSIALNVSSFNSGCGLLVAGTHVIDEKHLNSFVLKCLFP